MPTPAQRLEHLFRRTLEDLNPRAATRATLDPLPVNFDHASLIAVGKGAAAMAEGVADMIRVSEGIVLCPVAPPTKEQLPGVRYFETDHPVPTARNVEASRALRDFAESRSSDTPCIAAISGGGSAQVCLPVEPLTFEDLAAATDALLRSGLPIEDINAVRMQLDQLKAGRLATLIAPAPLLSLVIVDVPSGDPAFVSSGPTIPPTTPPSAPRILELARAAALHTARPSVMRALERTLTQPTPAPRHTSEHDRVRIVFDNRRARARIAHHADSDGLAVRIHDDLITGPAEDRGRELAQAALRASAGITAPTLLIWGGETTVRVPDATVPGGRCQHMALAAAIELEGATGITFAALGTDGVDGTTNACGAIVDGSTAPNARAIGLDPATALAACRAHELLAATDRLVRTGPTGTNVNELYLALVQPVR